MKETEPQAKADRSGSWLWQPFHPFAISLLPLVIILAQNSGEISPTEAIRSGLLSIVFVSLIGLIFFVITREFNQAAISASLIAAYFHTSGRISSGNVMTPLRAVLIELGTVGLLGLFSFLILVLILSLPRLRAYFPHANLFLNVIGLSLLVSFTCTVAYNEWKIHQPKPEQALGEAPADVTYKPDIYYIVLDGYARHDVLRGMYGAEALPFVDYLSSEGFHIVDEACSNYMQTSLSLASSLNADYVQNLLSQPELESQDRLLLLNLLRNNRVGGFLSDNGYSVTLVESGYRPTEVLKSTVRYSTTSLEPNLFERLVIENSLLRAARLHPAAPDWIMFPGYARHRLRVEDAFDRLILLSKEQAGRRFIVAHVLVPHPPFVFNSEGTARQPEYPYVLLDGDAFPGDQNQYRQEYEEQRAFLDNKLISIIDSIIANQGDNAVIILQADHGPGSELSWSSVEDTNLRERFGILMAYRYPDSASLSSYEPKSPVNLFRMILGDFFGVDLPALPEWSYYSTWDQPLTFIQLKESALELINPVRD